MRIPRIFRVKRAADSRGSAWWIGRSAGIILEAFRWRAYTGLVRQGHDEGAAVFGDVQAGERDEKHGALRRRGGESAAGGGTLYVDKYELPKPYPQRIRVTIEPAE